MRHHAIWTVTISATLAACAAVVGVDEWPGGTGSSQTASGGDGQGGADVATSTGVGAASSTASSVTASSSDGSGGSGGSAATGGAGGHDDGAVVPCGAKLCAAAEVCCVNPLSNEALECAAPGGCGMNTEISCDGPDDCTNGSVCCGIWDVVWLSVSCMAPAACVPGPPHWVMCGADLVKNDAACSGKTCTEDMQLVGHWYCQ